MTTTKLECIWYFEQFILVNNGQMRLDGLNPSMWLTNTHALMRWALLQSSVCNCSSIYINFDASLSRSLLRNSCSRCRYSVAQLWARPLTSVSTWRAEDSRHPGFKSRSGWEFFQLDWTSGHAMRLNFRTGIQGPRVSSLNCDRPLHSGLKAAELVMDAGCRDNIWTASLCSPLVSLPNQEVGSTWASISLVHVGCTFTSKCVFQKWPKLILKEQSTIISKRYEIGCPLLLITNMKLHTGFDWYRHLWPWITSNGIIALFCFFPTEFDSFAGWLGLCHSGWRCPQNIVSQSIRPLLAKTNAPCSAVSVQ